MRNGIDFERASTGSSGFSISTPSFRGYTTRITPGVFPWRVIERDTWRQLGEGTAKSADDAINQMTKVMAEEA